MLKLRKIVPFLISIALLVIIVRLAPWAQVWDLLRQLSLGNLVLLLALSLTYYLLKAVRFWYMLRVINIEEKLSAITLIYISAQPVTLLPAGELYRMKALENYRGVPMNRSVPTFTAQGVFEGLGMAIVGIVAALTLHIGRIPALIMIAVVIAAIIGIRMGGLSSIMKELNRLPFVNVSRQRIRAFSEQNKAMLSGNAFTYLAIMSLIIELVGVAICYISVDALGADLTFSQAALVYILPIIVGFISFLPGGFGAAEQASIGLLIVMGVGGALAVAATLLMRAFIVGSGLIYSAVAWVWLRATPGVRKRSYRRHAGA